MSKYAVLFAGCGDLSPEGCAIRYKNDLEYMYSVLVNKYNYDVENVNVLLADGKQEIRERLNGRKISTKPGTYTNFKETIERYRNLQYDDQLLIMISNHGGPARLGGDAVILGFMPYEEINITMREFRNIVNELVCKKVIVMGQCYGGDFLDLDINNSIIISANEKGKESYGVDDIEYDEFLYHFTSFFNEVYPDGQALNNNTYLIDKSVSSAFQYACDNDRLSNGSLQCDEKENPQIKENNLLSKNVYL